MKNISSESDKKKEILNIIRNTQKKSYINGGIIYPYGYQEKKSDKKIGNK